MFRWKDLKEEILNIVLAIILLATIWTIVTSFVFWVGDPGLSQMEVFLHIPKSFMLDFY